MGLSITFAEIPEQEAGSPSWPLRVSVESTEAGLDSEVFVYHAGGTTASANDYCECVASITQMYGLPKDQPGEIDNLPIPFYRKDTAEFHFPSMDQLLEAKDIIIEDLQGLLRAHRSFSSVVDTQTIELT